MTAQRVQRHSAVDFPHFDSFVEKSRCDQPPVGTDRDRPHIISSADFILLVELIVNALHLLLNFGERLHELNTGPVGFGFGDALLDVLKHV